MWSQSIFCLLLLAPFLAVQGIFIPWGNNAGGSGSFLVRPDAVGFQGVKEKPRLQKYLNTSKIFSLDQRCSLSMPLSAMWHEYMPYAGVSVAFLPGLGFRYTVKGLFPQILTEVLKHCCPGSNVEYGLFLKTIRGADSYIGTDLYDFTFPIYGFDSKSTKFKDRPFISLVQSPRVILLIKDIPEKMSKTETLLDSILQAWPFLLFIFATALCAGFIVWVLDRTSNPVDFPPSFFAGASEGFWWAFITMTTIGYGDKTPKSNLSRAFCCMWMVLGLTCFSIYTGLVTAALSSSPPPFSIPGSKIGAMNGSEEYKLGVLMQADMTVFGKVLDINSALREQKIDGGLIDSYIINYFGSFISKEKIFMVEQTIPHTINYGVVLGKAPRLEQCFRNYVLNNPREIFKIINSVLKPLKNPADNINQDLRATEDLLANEDMFNSVVKWGGVPLAVVFTIGILYDTISYLCSWCRQRKNAKKNMLDNSEYVALTEVCKKPKARREVRKLTHEFEKFHENWIKNFDDVHKDMEQYQRYLDEEGNGFEEEEDHLLKMAEPSQPTSSTEM